MSWTNLHYIQNPALRIAEQKNILMSQIESAKQAQKERHHNDLLSVQNAKLMLEERLGLRKLDDERQRHQDNLQMQQQQINNQLQIANIQANNQLELEQMRSSTQMQGLMLGHFSAIAQQTNQAFLNMLQAMLNDTINHNQHQRNMEQQEYLSRIELIKIKLQQKHEREMTTLNHNLLLVEKRLDSHLKREEIDFDKYSTVFYKLLEQVLGLSEANTKIDEEAIDRYTDDLFYQMYGERALNNR